MLDVLFVPENLNLEERIKSKILLEKHYWFIHHVITRPIYNKKYDDYKYYEVYSRDLIHILGKQYSSIINNLIKWNIIKQYIIPFPICSQIHKCNSYNLTDDYKNQKVRTVNISQRLQRRTNNKQTTYIHNKHYMCSTFLEMMKNIEVDYSGGVQFIDNLLKNNSIVRGKQFTIQKYVYYYISLYLFKHQEFFCNPPDKYGRIHSSITNFPSILKQFLYYKGNKLSEVDIVNSQPMFLNMIIKNNKRHQHKDCKHYLELTLSGKFYEYLIEEYNKKYKGKCIDRIYFKKKIFREIFFNDTVNKEKPNRLMTLFQELFPNVWLLIQKLKKEDYRSLAHQLQRVESDIMINTVADELIKKGIFFLTIHDSIITDAKYIDDVKKEILNAFWNKYKIVPALK